jgi:alkanesulfonate monooxygenase SsuD/methylene tetrahydromethanopterin reductase-like flavin-dependent oxidoreductase (luciferase family)
MHAFSADQPSTPQSLPTMSMILAASASANGSHVGEWRHPDAWDKPVVNIANSVRLAQIAEAGKLDALFLADGNGVRQCPPSATLRQIASNLRGGF